MSLTGSYGEKDLLEADGNVDCSQDGGASAVLYVHTALLLLFS